MIVMMSKSRALLVPVLENAVTLLGMQHVKTQKVQWPQTRQCAELDSHLRLPISRQAWVTSAAHTLLMAYRYLVVPIAMTKPDNSFPAVIIYLST